jgi:creatinine amidohydrolase
VDDAQTVELPMVLENMTVLETREALKTVKTALLPVGCVEQHGYHLPIGTDSLTADYICSRAAEEAVAFLLPIQKYSFSGGRLEGTVQIQPDTVYRVMRDILGSLYDQGIRGVVIISGHGGGKHVAAIREAVAEMTEARSGYVIAFACVGRVLSEKCRDVLRSERVGSSHATEVETAMIQHIAPGLVREDKLDCWEDRDALRDPISDVDGLIQSRVRENQEAFDARVRIGVGACPVPARDGCGGVILDDCVKTVVKMVERVNELVG